MGEEVSKLQRWLTLCLNLGGPLSGAFWTSGLSSLGMQTVSISSASRTGQYGSPIEWNHASLNLIMVHN